MRTYIGLRENERCEYHGWPLTSLNRTIGELALARPFDDLVYLLDGVLNGGDDIRLEAFTARVRARLAKALALADARSESALETAIRLVLKRAGLEPETLQWRVFDENGWCFARLDLAWPGHKVAIEADGLAYHDVPKAVLRDRWRQNQLEALGWTVLRFTWRDVMDNPDEIIDRVATALGLRTSRACGCQTAM
jgi:very-short-patch-repair endonuclease